MEDEGPAASETLLGVPAPNPGLQRVASRTAERSKGTKAVETHVRELLAASQPTWRRFLTRRTTILTFALVVAVGVGLVAGATVFGSGLSARGRELQSLEERVGALRGEQQSREQQLQLVRSQIEEAEQQLDRSKRDLARSRCEAQVASIDADVALSRSECLGKRASYQACVAGEAKEGSSACFLGLAAAVITGGAALAAAGACLGGQALASLDDACGVEPTCSDDEMELKRNVLARSGLLEPPDCAAIDLR